MTDDIAEQARKIGGNTLHSISDISEHQRLKDDNRESIRPEDMLAGPSTDNRELTRFLRKTHKTCQGHNDVATASLIKPGSTRLNGARGFCQKRYAIIDTVASATPPWVLV